MLPIHLALLLIPLALALALTAPLYFLVLMDLALSIFRGTWQLSGILFDPTDVVLAAIVAGLAVRGWRPGAEACRIPYRGLWISLGLLSSLAYLHAPVNRPFLSDPVRVGYQLYRYCWKPILYYAVTALFLADRKRLQAALLTIVLSADVLSVVASYQGYVAGVRASGTLGSPNSLSGALIMPFVISLAALLFAELRWQRLFYGASILIIIRALTFSGSRGGLVGVIVGAGFLVVWAAIRGYGRRLFRVALASVIITAGMFCLKPDVLERPNVGRLLTVTHPLEVGNFQWRMHERWPVFWRKVVENPWLGVGTDVDKALGPSANTPHNGYLALAAERGVPVMLIIFAFGVLTIMNGITVFVRQRHSELRILGLISAAAMAGLLTHNITESTLLLPLVAKTFWALAAFAALLAQRPSAFMAGAPAGVVCQASPGQHRSVPLTVRTDAAPSS